MNNTTRETQERFTLTYLNLSNPTATKLTPESDVVVGVAKGSVLDPLRT